jgi:hypothetical protein
MIDRKGVEKVAANFRGTLEKKQRRLIAAN